MYIDKIKNTHEHLISAQSGKITFSPQNLNFAAICMNILKILNPNASSKKVTINPITTNQIVVFGDKDMLNSVLWILISNAIKFTNRGGEIDIKAEENQKYTIISVSDNGIGMSPEKMKKLFDTSQIQTNASGTTGFGLLLCKEFIEKHGGEIWVRSRCGKGSDIKFSLPVRN